MYASQIVKQSYTYLVFRQGEQNDLKQLYKGRTFRGYKRVIDHFKEVMGGHIQVIELNGMITEIRGPEESYLVYKIKHGEPHIKNVKELK